VVVHDFFSHISLDKTYSVFDTFQKIISIKVQGYDGPYSEEEDQLSEDDADAGSCSGASDVTLESDEDSS